MGLTWEWRRESSSLPANTATTSGQKKGSSSALQLIWIICSRALTKGETKDMPLPTSAAQKDFRGAIPLRKVAAILMTPELGPGM